MKSYVFAFTVVPTDNSWQSPYRNESERISADSLKEAKEKFYNVLNNRYYLSVSANAKKTARKMYCDTKDGSVKQTGIVIKAKTDAEFNGRWVTRYADVWAEINELVSPFE